MSDMNQDSVVSRRYPKEIKSEVISYAREGKNWSQRARDLGVRHQAAYYWVSSAHKNRNRDRPASKMGKKRVRGSKLGRRSACSHIDSEVISFVCNLYEADPKMTLARICQRLEEEKGVSMAQSTAHKYLRSMVFARCKYSPADHSSLVAKEDTKGYISAVSNYIKDGREIIWLGGIIYNLHTRKSVSRLQDLHIHTLAAISSQRGLLHASHKRGPYFEEDQAAWAHEHFPEPIHNNQQKLPPNAVVVSETTIDLPIPWHSATQLTPPPLFTDRLSPCDKFWGTVTTSMKSMLMHQGGDQKREQRVLPIGGYTDDNQRLHALEKLLDKVIKEVAGGTVPRESVGSALECLDEVLRLVNGLKEEGPE